jgi:hypothetical protein
VKWWSRLLRYISRLPPARERWVTLHLPPPLAAKVGQTAARQGVPLETAIGAALWVFSTLPMADKAGIIREYLERSGDIARSR